MAPRFFDVYGPRQSLSNPCAGVADVIQGEAAALERIGCEPNVRAEALAPHEFTALARAL